MKKYAAPLIGITIAVIISAFVITMKKTIIIIDSGKKAQFISYRSTVRQAIDSKKIKLNSKDKVFPSLNSRLSDGETITITRAVNVTVNVDGKVLNIQSPEKNIISMLKAEDIKIGSMDKVEPDIKSSLTPGMKIDIIRVEVKNYTQRLALNFKEVVKNNERLPNTKRSVISEGRDGEKEVTTKVVYENGKEVSRNVVSEVILKNPSDRVIVQGTYPSMPVSRGGNVLPYARVVKVRATAYWAVNGVGKTYTGSGRKAIRNPDGYSTIAVDRNLIPYGTRLFVEGYGFAIAADTGTAIIGKTIDVYFNTYKEACHWGVKYVNLYILE